MFEFTICNDDALASVVFTLAAHIHAATYRLLTLIAELDRREVWAAQGARSCAHWLSWACGIDTHTAREKIRVARALTELPLLCEAEAKGELGYSKVRALTRIATAENEDDPQNIGLHGTAQNVEKFARLHRQAKREEETERVDAQHENRGLTFWHEDDGTVVLHVRFPPEMGSPHPERARCGDGGACDGAAGGGMKAWRRGTSHVGRLDETHPLPMLVFDSISGNTEARIQQNQDLRW